MTSETPETHATSLPPTLGRAITVSADMPAALMPLAWLIGTWEGVGVATRDGEEYQFGQQVSFHNDGREFLAYTSQTWRLDADGNPATPDDRETGYWRLAADGECEVVLSNAEGYVEVYVGQAAGPRIEIVTDLVGRTVSAPGYAAGKRLYGLVEGDLLYAHDASFAKGEDAGVAAGETVSAPLRSARLTRVSS